MTVFDILINTSKKTNCALVSSDSWIGMSSDECKTYFFGINDYFLSLKESYREAIFNCEVKSLYVYNNTLMIVVNKEDFKKSFFNLSYPIDCSQHIEKGEENEKK